MREYLNVGQMSALFHLNKQTLQYYDREKIFSPAYRNPENNYRMYRFDQVYVLALICYLRKLAFPSPRSRSISICTTAAVQSRS